MPIFGIDCQWFMSCDLFYIRLFFVTRTLIFNYTVSQKTSPFYICNKLIKCQPILPILAKNTHQEIWNKHKCTDNHIAAEVRILIGNLHKF